MLSINYQTESLSISIILLFFHLILSRILCKEIFAENENEFQLHSFSTKPHTHTLFVTLSKHRIKAEKTSFSLSKWQKNGTKRKICVNSTRIDDELKFLHSLDIFSNRISLFWFVELVRSIEWNIEKIGSVFQSWSRNSCLKSSFDIPSETITFAQFSSIQMSAKL